MPTVEIIALQEYTDQYISLYEGEIRNISIDLANKLIEKGIVELHSDNSSTLILYYFKTANKLYKAKDTDTQITINDIPTLKSAFLNNRIIFKECTNNFMEVGINYLITRVDGRYDSLHFYNGEEELFFVDSK